MGNLIVSRFVVGGVCLGLFTGAGLAQNRAGAGASAALLVVNQGDRNVSVIDPATGRQVAAITENVPAVHVHEAAASPDGRTAYLPVYGSTGVGKPGLNGQTMMVVDIASQKLVGNVDFGHEVRPHCPVFDPVSGLLYVTTELDKTVTAIDPRTLKIVGTIPTGQEQSHMLAISSDGKRGYTANVGPGTVSVLDLKARKTLAIIPISKTTQRISVSRDDSMVFTSDQTQPRLAVIDTATNKVSPGDPARQGLWHRFDTGRPLAAGGDPVDERGRRRRFEEPEGGADHCSAEGSARGAGAPRRQGGLRLFYG